MARRLLQIASFDHVSGGGMGMRGGAICHIRSIDAGVMPQAKQVSLLTLPALVRKGFQCHASYASSILGQRWE